MRASYAALRDKSNLIVAAAVTIAGDQKHADLTSDLEAAFERFLVEPEKTDKLYRAKVAIIQGLDKLEHEQPAIFLPTSKHVQFEPVWGGQEDSAALDRQRFWHSLESMAVICFRYSSMRSSILKKR